MREKIKRLAKENFEYELPEILLSEEQISIIAEIGSVATGSLWISNEQEKKMKGIVYSSLPELHIINPMFNGKTNEIQYRFDAKKAIAGEKSKGKLFIVSCCGEVNLPISIEVTEAYGQTSLGKIKDLFHFANLAQSDWEEALQLFETRDFGRIFLKEEHLKTLYASLIKGKDRNVALEEFLIAIQKKSKINITVDRTELLYTKCLTNFADKITIMKDNWGYEKIQIEGDAPFLVLEKKEITTKDFIGNSFDLEFLVDASFLRKGNNFGRITIQTIFSTMEVTVSVSVLPKKKHEEQRKRKEQILIFFQNYLNLRTNQIAPDQYIAELSAIIKNGKETHSFWEHKLLKLHYYIMDHQPLAEDVIKDMEENQEAMKEESILFYSSFLYLRALYTKKKEYIEEAASSIRTYYENGFDKWQMLWFLLYLDGDYDRNSEKMWKDIEGKLEKGVNSPVLYYEACLCLQNDKRAREAFAPVLLRVLSWGIRMNCLNQELIDLYCFTAEQEGKADFWILKPLFALYDHTKSKEILFSICKILIQNKKKDAKYFPWFSLGEEENLKIENLYEYYLYTMPEDYQKKIPSSLLLFFQYDNNLTWEKKAYLYAYIVKNKNKDKNTYLLYHKKMQKFTIEQIKEERMDENLSVLYQEFIQLEEVKEGISPALSEIMFRHKLVCTNENIIGVYVSHKEMEKEEYTLLKDGIGYIQVFTESPSIVFIDKNGNRYGESISFQLTELLHIHGLAQKCYEVCKNSPMLMMHLFEKIDKYQKNNEYSIYVQRRCILLPGFKNYYKGRCYERLISYYFEAMENEALKEMLLIADFDLLKPDFRSKAISYCMIHELYEKTLFSLREYGFDGIPTNQLIRFCTEEIEKNGLKIKNKFQLDLAFYLFQEGKYNEIILCYLMEHFEGSTKMLLQLWNCAQNFQLDTYGLEEKLLGQMLFGESYVMTAYDVFHSYYNKGGDPTIIKAFLCYNAYKYLLNERIVHPEIFELLKKENCFEESTVCILALLFYYSGQETLAQEELAFCEKQIKKMTERGILLPCYKKFSDRMTLPLEIRSHYFVEYKCNPKNSVKIHYFRENGENRESFITETMEDSYYGIHVIKFLLFQDEVLQYYISEDNGKEEIITESVRVDMKNAVNEESNESMFELLNLMLTAKEMQDEKTMLALMKYYAKIKYAGKTLIKIL
ncbi:MAG: DUF5717 family protein [Acetivibrio sp.]